MARTTRSTTTRARPDRSGPFLVLRPLTGYVAALGLVGLTTVLIALSPTAQHMANISYVFLLAVIAVALRFGSGPAIAASVLAFLAFDWFFVEPHYTLTVEDSAEWLALLMFLLTAAVTGQLTASLQAAAQAAAQHEREAKALADVSWTIAAQVDQDRALAVVLQRLREVSGASAAAILQPVPGDSARMIAWSGSQSQPASVDPGLDQACDDVFAQARGSGWEGGRHHGSAVAGPPPDLDAVYLPLIIEQRVLGVLYLHLPSSVPLQPEVRRAVESLVNLAAVILERERLTAAQTRGQALAEADRLKTALLSMVSHDFRSPLASIKASVSSLLQEGEPMEADTQREMLVGIEREADRLNRMVGDILALSRLEADAWRPQMEPTPPVEVIGAALAPFGADSNRRIQARLDPQLPEVWLDPVQIAQVIHNLVENALKYGGDGPIEVQAACRNGRFVVEVCDRGPGLSPGEEAKVFERFYRSPRWQESAVPGMGIGLAVSKGLAEAHNGTLTATARPGGGSVFRLDLPATSVLSETKEASSR